MASKSLTAVSNSLFSPPFSLRPLSVSNLPIASRTQYQEARGHRGARSQRSLPSWVQVFRHRVHDQHSWPQQAPSRGFLVPEDSQVLGDQAL